VCMRVLFEIIPEEQVYFNNLKYYIRRNNKYIWKKNYEYYTKLNKYKV
jgi:hypothetical protein